MRSFVSSLLELVGLAAVTTGAYMAVPWLGFLVGGAALLLVGYAMDYAPERPE